MATLTDSEAIISTIVRFVQALDDSDASLLASTLTDDMVMDVTAFNGPLNTAYPIFEGRDVVVPGLIKATSMDTMHSVSNFRVEIHESGEEAELNCYAQAQHLRKGEGLAVGKDDYFLMGNRYRVTLVKDREGGWRIRRKVITPVWFVGDVGVMKVE